MPIKIKRQDCLIKYPVFPLRSYDDEKEEEVFFYPHIFKSYVLTLPARLFEERINHLGPALAALAKSLYADSLLFLGDTQTPWLYQVNNYKPVKAALEYLASQKIRKRFNGALEVNVSELPLFVVHLAWLTRCNAALPYFHFINKEQNIIGSICKHGNIHLDPLNESADEHIQLFLNSNPLLRASKQCY